MRQFQFVAIGSPEIQIPESIKQCVVAGNSQPGLINIEWKRDLRWTGGRLFSIFRKRVF